MSHTPCSTLVMSGSGPVRAASVGFRIRSDPELLDLVGAGSGIFSVIILPDWHQNQIKVVLLSDKQENVQYGKSNFFLKVLKHEIILNFFFPKSKPYMSLVSFRKKFDYFIFLRFLPEFRCSNIFMVTEHTLTKFVW
jgi:hypothetical protein